jgi:hypothetical protein
MDGRTGRPPVRILGQSASVATCWLVGMAFALLDAVTTWYALEILGLHEGNPVAKWAIEQWGLSRALLARIVLGAIVLGLLAAGCYARVPHDRALVNRACRIVLVGALVLWGVVACSNAFQIALVKLS